MSKTKFNDPDVAPVRLADRLADQLADRIKHLPIGAKLPSENEMATEHKVSRTVVREAIAQLKAVGMLRTRQGAGIFISTRSRMNLTFRELDHHNPMEIIKFWEIRSGLDAAAARLAATRRTKTQLAAMRDLCHRSVEDISVVKAAESDAAFHLAIVEATANEYFVSVQKFLGAHLREGVLFIRRVESYSPEMLKEVRVEHFQILEAIADKNPELAARSTEEHILNSQKRLKYCLSHLVKLIGDF